MVTCACFRNCIAQKCNHLFVPMRSFYQYYTRRVHNKEKTEPHSVCRKVKRKKKSERCDFYANREMTFFFTTLFYLVLITPPCLAPLKKMARRFKIVLFFLCSPVIPDTDARDNCPDRILRDSILFQESCTAVQCRRPLFGLF